MIALLQRVSQASVTVGDEIVGQIGPGLLILLGITHDDGQEDIDWLVKKIVDLRIFADEEDKMNRSVKDIGGQILLVSQFTLHAATKKGNRPSFLAAARPEVAIPLYELTINRLAVELGKPIQTGVFGAMMEVALINDGPVTIWIDSKNKQ